MSDYRQKDDWEMAETAAKKVARAAVRLKYSIAADYEINDKLPEVETAVRKAVAEGRDWTLDVQALFLGEGDAVIDRPKGVTALGQIAE